MSKRTIKNKRILRIAIGVSGVALFLFSGWKIAEHCRDMWKSEATVNRLTELAITHTVLNNELLNRIESDTEETVSPETSPISVDFDVLREENDDIVAWIYSNDTSISYPIVQSEDNNYYLRHLLDGTWNTAGTLFLDYRCADGFAGFTSVIYGHNMKNDTMFGTLPEYRNQVYYDEHPTMYLLTPTAYYRVDLFAGYVTPSDSEAYQIDYSEEDKQSFITQAKEQSDFKAAVEVAGEDCLLILSTCSYEYNNARYVVIGKLTEVAMPESYKE